MTQKQPIKLTKKKLCILTQLPRVCINTHTRFFLGCKQLSENSSAPYSSLKLRRSSICHGSTVGTVILNIHQFPPVPQTFPPFCLVPFQTLARFFPCRNFHNPAIPPCLYFCFCPFFSYFCSFELSPLDLGRTQKRTAIHRTRRNNCILLVTKTIVNCNPCIHIRRIQYLVVAPNFFLSFGRYNQENFLLILASFCLVFGLFCGLFCVFIFILV